MNIRFLETAESRAIYERNVREQQERTRLALETELALMQKIALLKLHHMNLSQKVARTLVSVEAFGEYPCYRDYCSLADIGLAQREPGCQYHNLSSLGEARARLLVKQECNRLGIHELRGGGLVGRGDCSYSCTCGQWSWTGRAGSSTAGNMSRSFTRHLKTTAAPSIVPEQDADAVQERIE
jgi:hypothetical protein